MEIPAARNPVRSRLREAFGESRFCFVKEFRGETTVVVESEFARLEVLGLSCVSARVWFTTCSPMSARWIIIRRIMAKASLANQADYRPERFRRVLPLCFRCSTIGGCA